MADQCFLFLAPGHPCNSVHNLAVCAAMVAQAAVGPSLLAAYDVPRRVSTLLRPSKGMPESSGIHLCCMQCTCHIACQWQRCLLRYVGQLRLRDSCSTGGRDVWAHALAGARQDVLAW